jgi:hypothetical protein
MQIIRTTETVNFTLEEFLVVLVITVGIAVVKKIIG